MNSLIHKDIFYDAYFNSKGIPFLAEDYITHHENPFKNPNPVKFLKVLPYIDIKFQFHLKNNLLSCHEKKDLFRIILLLLGVGAKTNVGYGRLVDAEESSLKNTAPIIEQINIGIKKENLKEGDILEAKIISLSSGIQVDLCLGHTFNPFLTGISTAGFSKGQIIQVKITSVVKRLEVVYHSTKN
ncbi:MAG: type III-B CRISPR module RAMP protein Cmr6 [Saprospiraceae bacterium]|nr:type III-B CRISPR module RAMP protein Cmr6 [Saprospiraceae bacterium]